MPKISPDGLRALADDLSSTLADLDGHALVGVTADPGSAAGITTRPFTTHRPEGELLGFTAPESWWAVGARMKGTFRQSGRGADGQVRQPRASFDVPRPAVMTFVMDRSGQTETVIIDADGTAHRRSGEHTGYFGDLFRRIVGLPTPAPPPDTTELWLNVWLHRVADSVAVLGADRHSTWDTAAAIHPAFVYGTATTTASPDGLALANHDLADAWTWDRLRDDPAFPETPEYITRHVATWMDDGMFARCTLANLPTIEDLTYHLRQHLPSAVLADIREAVTLSGHAWPGTP